MNKNSNNNNNNSNNNNYNNNKISKIESKLDIISDNEINKSKSMFIIMEAFDSPEIKKSLYYTLLLTISTMCQLIADTYITSLVGNKGSEFSVARGVVGTILGFAFFVFGFLTDGFTSKVSRVYGSSKQNDPILGAWIKTAILAGFSAGSLTLLAFGPTYKLWLNTFINANDPSYSLISAWYWTRLLGMTPNLIYNAIMGVLQGMQMPLYIVTNNIFLAVVDIVCNYLFLNVLYHFLTQIYDGLFLL